MFLSLEEVLEIHQQQIECYGRAPGVRELPFLESAAQRQATFSAEFLPGSPLPRPPSAWLLPPESTRLS